MAGNRPGDHDNLDDLTIAASRAATRLPSSVTPTPSSLPFAPGAIIAGRYRLVSLLGRGGMGEVYRADDLTLDQPVALKFLPAGVASDPDRLAQFHAELRVARQVSHKNVCRLYDLGDHEGRRFLTMEYVDGEDLATLLRRIGRLPQDKAVDIARQLCAGLAAAHERGVLHRDLKPANVMIDGDGNVRITDFGLAVAAADVKTSRAGTPQYMAPELLAGGPASVKTDIYALGLVLFEMFTGRRAFEAKTFNELMHLHETRTLAMPTSVVRDLDPAVERVILRCLEEDAELRPGSVIAVAAALPGGDPLAAALAAGETPSPEMVAAAGETRGVSAPVGVALLAAVIAGLLGLAALADRALLISAIPLDRSADALEDHARDIVSQLGYTERPIDTARGYFVLQDYFTYKLRTDPSPSRWDSLSTGAFPSLRFWYRTSPRELEPQSGAWAPSFGDPPLTVSNMVAMVVDTEGRLTQFNVAPPQVDDASPGESTPVEWTRVFQAAGLDMAQFHAAPSLWVPNVFADERRAWLGPLPAQPDIELRVEAGAYRGRVSFFQVVGPWTRRPRMDQELLRGAGVGLLRFGGFLIVILLFVGGLLLARHNVRNGRGDRRGATRVTVFVFGLSVASWVLGASHALDPMTEFRHFRDSLIAPELLKAATLWLTYVALEPYVRRYRPEILVSWTRVLAGRLRDPRVGRDILVGVATGIVLAATRIFGVVAPRLFGYAPLPPRTTNFEFLLGTRYALSALLDIPQAVLTYAMLVTLAFVFARLVVKRTVIAAAIAGAMLTVLLTATVGTEQLVVNVPSAIVVAAISMAVLVYFGVFAQAVAFLVNNILSYGGLTADFSKLYAPTSVSLIVLVAAMAAYGLYVARSGEPIFGRRLADT